MIELPPLSTEYLVLSSEYLALSSKPSRNG
jgi:hypothetical protein